MRRRVTICNSWATLLPRITGLEGTRPEIYLDDELPRIHTPTLVIWGEHDMAPADVGLALASQSPLRVLAWGRPLSVPGGPGAHRACHLRLRERVALTTTSQEVLRCRPGSPPRQWPGRSHPPSPSPQNLPLITKDFGELVERLIPAGLSVVAVLAGGEANVLQGELCLALMFFERHRDQHFQGEV